MGLTPGISTSSSGSLLKSIIGQVELAALFFAPSKAPTASGRWWSCISTGFRTVGNDLNPFDPGDSKFTNLMALAGAAQQGAASLSDASYLAVGAYSVERGLTVPLRSSTIRAGLSNAEWLGDVAVGLSAASLVAAGIDGAVAEWNQCVP